jgi:hypothetical protein
MKFGQFFQNRRVSSFSSKGGPAEAAQRPLGRIALSAAKHGLLFFPCYMVASGWDHGIGNMLIAMDAPSVVSTGLKGMAWFGAAGNAAMACVETGRLAAAAYRKAARPAP